MAQHRHEQHSSMHSSIAQHNKQPRTTLADSVIRHMLAKTVASFAKARTALHSMTSTVQHGTVQHSIVQHSKGLHSKSHPITAPNN